MAATKITLPNGHVFKTTSRFRYAVVCTRTEFPVSVEKRSDNLSTVRTVFDGQRDTYVDGDSYHKTRYFLVDTVTGEVTENPRSDING